MINCNASVEAIHIVKPGEVGLNKYKVEVWGVEPYDFVRIYEIHGKSDTIAAQEGLRRFEEEMERVQLDTRN